MQLRMIVSLLSMMSVTTMLACDAKVEGQGNEDDAGHAERDSGPVSQPFDEDGGGVTDPIEIMDAGPPAPTYPLPPECASPGPFINQEPYRAQIATGIVGTWVYCDDSIFSNIQPYNDAGIVAVWGVGISIGTDGTWHELQVSNATLVPIPAIDDQGTWYISGGGASNGGLADAGPAGSHGEGNDAGDDGTGFATLQMLSQGGLGVAVAPELSADGRTIRVSTSAGGHQATMARAVGTN